VAKKDDVHKQAEELAEALKTLVEELADEEAEDELRAPTGSFGPRPRTSKCPAHSTGSKRWPARVPGRPRTSRAVRKTTGPGRETSSVS
jgi:hypothetical protein